MTDKKMIMSCWISDGEIPEPLPNWLFEGWKKGYFSFIGFPEIIMPDGTKRRIRKGDHVYQENDERPYIIPRECLPTHEGYLNKKE